MPFIPFIQKSNPIRDAAAPVLDNQRRPTVDNSGKIAAVGNLNKASKLPELPDSLAAPYGALGAVGRAVAQGGDLLSALAIKQREAESDIQIADADNKMLTARADFENWKIDNPDPSTWKDEWQNRLGGLEKTITENDKLHEGARVQIGMRMTRYAGQSNADVAMGAAKETFARAKSTYIAAFDSAKEVQDKDRAAQVINDGQAKGYFYPHEAEAMSQAFTQRGKQLKREEDTDTFDAARNQVTAVASELGAETAVKRIDGNDYGVKEEFDKERLRDLARNVDQESRSNFAAGVANGLASGEINSEAKIKELAEKNPRLFTPVLQEKARDSIRAEARETILEDRAKNGFRNALEIKEAIKGVNPKDDPRGEKLFKLMHDIGTRAEPTMAGELRTELMKKYKLEGPPEKLRPEIQQNISKSLDLLFDAKAGIIPWSKKVQYKDAKGTLRSQYMDYPEDKQRALDAKAGIEIKMADWAKMHPDASLQQTREQLQKFIPDGTRGAGFDSIMKNMKSEVAPATPAPTGKEKPVSSATRDALRHPSLPEPSPLEDDGLILPPLGEIP